MKKSASRLGWILFTLLIAAVITYFSSQTGDESAGASWDVARRIRPVLRLDDAASVLYYINLVIRKLAHFGLFAALGCGLLGSLRYQKRVSPFLVAVVTGAVFGALDELHQGFVPGRVPAVHDVIIDALGVLAGAAVTLYVLRRLEQRKGKIAVSSPGRGGNGV